ncbi:MAG: MFS transporter [Myxococcota bacterium]
MPTERHATLQVLAIPNVRRFVTQRFFATLARSLLHATLAWHLWKASGSYAFLGWLGAVEFAPVIPASLVAGALADSWNRKAIMIISQAVAMLAACALWFGSANAAAEVPLVLVSAFALAMTTAFESPAGSALLPAMVPRELFQAATVVSSSVRNLAGVSGPVLMAAATKLAGIPAAYALTAGLFAVSIAALVRVVCPPIEGRRAKVDWESIREGIAFVRRHAVILSSITLDMFAVIFAGATALLPVYADEILDVGEWGYGILSASMQVGTLLMAALLLVAPPIRRPGRALLVSVLFFGVATIAFGLSRSFPVSVLAFLMAGMADQVSMVTRSVILQMSTPDALRGRVNSVNMIFIGASNELGAAESGFLAALTSATFSVVAGGAACLGVLATIWTGVPSLRRYRL